MDIYGSRVRAFQEKLGEKADAAFFPVSADMQYLTGVQRPFPNFGAVHHPGAWLEGVWVGVEGEPIITLTRMSSELSGVGHEAGIETRILGDWDDPAAQVAGILSAFGVLASGRLAIGDSTSGETVVELSRLLPGVAFASGSELLALQRRVKSANEIETMRQAGAVTESAFETVLRSLQHGMTELDVISEVDLQLRRRGARGPSFTTALYCSGPDHPMIRGEPEQTMNRPLDPPVAVLFDFGAIYQGYCYDFGRTVFFGAPDEAMVDIHHAVMESQAAGIAALKAGEATAEAADTAARQVIERAGYGAAFRHRLGHGIGLDVHEAPFLTAGDGTLLQAGMLFTVEPSITQQTAFSARVEDVVAVGDGGGTPLTRSHPELIVID
jgi:Xaa-Pro dipeptidase